MPNCLLCSQKLNNSLTLGELLALSAWRPEVLCPRCEGKFTAIDPAQSCPGCSRPQANQSLCRDCEKWQRQYPEALVQHTALFTYDGAMKEWLQAYKFQGDIRLAHVFAKALATYRRWHKDCLLVPIPLSPKSRESRGFSQCEELLKAAKLPYQPLLEHVLQGPKQSEKDRGERLASPQPFQMLSHQIEPQRRILLFDDVYTTGRTILHAKQTLLQQGFLQVLSLSLAR